MLELPTGTRCMPPQAPLPMNTRRCSGQLDTQGRESTCSSTGSAKLGSECKFITKSPFSRHIHCLFRYEILV